MAPEIEAGALLTKREPYHGWAADMWAYGALVFELLEGKPAFRGASTQQLNMRIVRASHEEFTSATPPPARSLVKKLLLLDGSMRMPARSAVAHGWFNSIRRRHAADGPSMAVEADAQYVAALPVGHGEPPSRPVTAGAEAEAPEHAPEAVEIV